MIPLVALMISSSVYAETYCSLRRAGEGEYEAVRKATLSSIYIGKAETFEFYGQDWRYDILEAQAAALSLCPDL